MTDEELMLAVCNGNQSAYQTIVSQHLKSISHYAYRLLGNRKDTEDITQETFLKLWVNAGKWQPRKAKLSTWLHRIAHNLCVDYLRKHGNTQTRESFDDETGELASRGIERIARIEREGDSPDNNSLENSNHARERAQQLEQAIAGLPENQRSALMLCHYSGFSNKEAAAIMNLSVKALESAIARAKRSLRNTLSETLGELEPATGETGTDHDTTGIERSEEKAATGVRQRIKASGSQHHDS